MAALWTRPPFKGLAVQGYMAPTEAEPVDPEDGFSLSGVGGFTLVAQCDLGQSFAAAAGSLNAYLHSELTGWVRAGDATLDLQIPASAIGRRAVVFSGFSVANPRDRIAHVASGLALSGGSLTLLYLGTNSKRFIG